MQRVKRSSGFHLCRPIIEGAVLTLSLKGMSIGGGGLARKDDSAEVFADHLDANIASGPFFSVELDRSQSLKIG